MSKLVTRGILILAACAGPASQETERAFSADPCTKVVLTAPTQGFVAPAGEPVVLTAAGTCPAGQTPEYQYWFKQFSAPNWTRLGAFVPGSSSWTPPSEDHWCVSVVVRTVGTSDGYQARSAAKCSTPRCGNGVIDSGEECDDRNNNNGDGCDANCTLPACGNAILDAGEECDDGNTQDADACEADCTIPHCGNTVVDTGEECDDGNIENGDACDVNCTFPRCGNTEVDPGEECDDGHAGNGDACDNNCTIPRCGNGALDPGEQCDDGNASNEDACDDSCAIIGFTYIKASNTGANDDFGSSVALSADGTTLAVGAFRESSAATGIDGNQASNAASESGAVYVYTRTGSTWIQQAYVKASNTDEADRFGMSVALSADGSTLVVGAPEERSAATSIGGNQADNSAQRAGAVYAFTRSGTTWSQQAYIKGSNTGSVDRFGWSVALSADGSLLAVGAILDGEVLSGAAYVFARSGTTWSQQAYIEPSHPDEGDFFGIGVALSADGTMLAVAAYLEDGAATGTNGDEGDNGVYNAGAVYMYMRTGAAWSQEAYIKASNTGEGDLFGASVALSADGATLAVGATGERSAATGINGDQANNALPSAGAVYVFSRSGVIWSQQAYVKSPSPDVIDAFGTIVALSADGNTLAVSATGEDSAAVGIGGDPTNNSEPVSGAAYVFSRSGATWSQRDYVKATNTDSGALFGIGLALSADGATLAVGASGESSSATGINGDQANHAAISSGAVYVY
jgi:cysteine-rich repeat protein